MAKRISIIASGAALIALLLAGLASGAKGPTKHHLVLTDQGAYLKTTAGYPAPGGRSVQAGLSTVKLDGKVRRGTSKRQIEVLGIEGGVGGPVVDFKGTVITYFRAGSSNASFHGTATFHEDGSASIIGNGRFVGGSGVYRGATGKFTLTGTLPHLPTVGTIVAVRAKGTITY
jgi:hypothetical protein